MTSPVELLREVMRWHSDPHSSDYNECDKEPCAWCESAAEAIAAWNKRPVVLSEAEERERFNVWDASLSTDERYVFNDDGRGYPRYSRQEFAFRAWLAAKADSGKGGE